MPIGSRIHGLHHIGVGNQCYTTWNTMPSRETCVLERLRARTRHLVEWVRCNHPNFEPSAGRGEESTGNLRRDDPTQPGRADETEPPATRNTEMMQTGNRCKTLACVHPCNQSNTKKARAHPAPTLFVVGVMASSSMHCLGTRDPLERILTAPLSWEWKMFPVALCDQRAPFRSEMDHRLHSAREASAFPGCQRSWKGKCNPRFQ